MAGTTKTTRIATLEDVTRRCSVGIAARATMLEEGIVHARQARAQLGEVEQYFASGLGALVAVKPAFSGTSEYMLTCSRLLSELTSGIENDLLDLRQIQVAITGLEEPTAEILQQFLAYSMDAIQSSIRSRMNKLGGDFSMPTLPRPTVNLGQIASPPRRRSESIPPREFTMSEIEEGMAMDSLVQAGLDNFERGGALLESSYDALVQAQAAVANANKALEALNRKFRALVEMESGSNSAEINGAIEQLSRLIADVEVQAGRLERLAGAAERVRAPLLAVFENMGRLLMTGMVAEGSSAESREAITAKDVLQRALKGDVSGIAEYVVVADDSQKQAMGDALYHAARTQELENALYAVEALRSLALSAGGSLTEAGDNLLSLSNSLSVPEAVRSAAMAALIDLTDGSGMSP
jgi:hypothetical protein